MGCLDDGEGQAQQAGVLGVDEAALVLLQAQCGGELAGADGGTLRWLVLGGGDSVAEHVPAVLDCLLVAAQPGEGDGLLVGEQAGGAVGVGEGVSVACEVFVGRDVRVAVGVIVGVLVGSLYSILNSGPQLPAPSLLQAILTMAEPMESTIASP